MDNVAAQIDDAKKEPAKKFVILTKAEIEKLSERDQYEYKIRLAKHKTRQLEKDYRRYKAAETNTNLSQDTKKLILLGKFLTAHFARDDRRTQNEAFRTYLDEYLTDDSDRQLLGFPLLDIAENHAEENHDQN